MQTVILKSPTTTTSGPYLRRQTILRSVSMEQTVPEPSQLKMEPPDRSPEPKTSKKSLEIPISNAQIQPERFLDNVERVTERFLDPQSEQESLDRETSIQNPKSAESNIGTERFLEHDSITKSELEKSVEQNKLYTSKIEPEQFLERVERTSERFLDSMETKEHFVSKSDDTMIENKRVLDVKLLSERDLELRKSNKELLEKYGWKEEYSYFGVKFKAPLIWFNIIMITLLHIVAVYSYCVYPARGHWKSVFWATFMGGVAGFGVTAGAHRLWCHRSYKAKLPLQILLAICFSAAGQNTIPEWVRDHRVHHKYSETDADPHNSNRGFFFAHVGWLMMKKHPAVLERGKSVDMTDILNDPLIKFHTKYFVPLKILFCFLLPSIVPVYFWNEGWLYTFYVQCVIRYTCSLNFTWSVNSLAHLYGKRPYDQRINPVENRFVAFIAMGEGWHNYHHVFPWDYKAAELAYTINITTMWIDLFAKLGWAYDRKQPSLELVKTISVKHGDGSHSEWGHKEIPDPYHGSQNNSNDNSHKTSERILNEKLL